MIIFNYCRRRAWVIGGCGARLGEEICDAAYGGGRLLKKVLLSEPVLFPIRLSLL
jgi:hypothetical protein